MPRWTIVIPIALAALAATWAQAQVGCTATTGGSCLTVHTAPGCSDPQCCRTVCDLFPPCCSETWDQQCVDIANQACVGLCGADVNGPCSISHANPSCDDATCCSTVCAISPSCCQFTWDDVCVILASQQCAPPPPTECGLPSQGACTQTHPTPGCSNGSCCETVCSYRPECCTFAWDALCVSFAQTYCVSCDLPCPAGAQTELEQCGARANQHCAQGQTPQRLADGATLCGTIDGVGGSGAWTGDMDAFAVTLQDPDGDGKVNLTIRLRSNGSAFVALVPAACPSSTAASTFHLNSSACVLAEASKCVEPGNYVLRVSPGSFPNAASVTTYTCDLPLKYLLSYSAVQAGCEPACDTSTGPCFDPHPGVGCNASECCEAACTVDPFCCEKIWDVLCARSAAEACGLPVPANDECTGAVQIGPGDSLPITTIRATTSAQALPAACDFGGGTNLGPDLWFRYDGERYGTVSASTCGSTTDLRIAVYRGACGAFELVGCNSSNPTCSPPSGARVQFQAACGISYYIRVAGEIPTQAGSATLTLGAAGPVCPAFCPPDLDRDGMVSGADIGLLLGNWGLFGAGDLDLDGTVGGSDLGLLLGAWGPCPAPPP